MRFLPLTPDDRQEMLSAIGVSSVNELYQHVPSHCLPEGLFDIPLHQGEMDIEQQFRTLAASNRTAQDGPFFLGAGCYYHHIPAAVDHLIQRSEFLTSYTPYQPEISQGTLAVVFQFQSMIANLTGMEVANASMYDGATSTAEAAMMARRVTGRSGILIGNNLHPHYEETLDTYIMHSGGELHAKEATDQTACVIIQYPSFHGTIEDLNYWRKVCDETGALLVVAVTEIVALGLLPAPTQADIVVGEAQSIGVGMNFGGPHLGFFACNKKHIRQMPGRLCGATTDADGKRSFVLTLSVREQHIRREKATSNICTNQGLCATAFTIHLSLLGEKGFKHLARLNHERACQLADLLAQVPGVTVLNDTFFNEFVISLPGDSAIISQQLLEMGVIAGYPLPDNQLLVAATEMTSTHDMATFVAALKEVL
ncbi:MAG: aminomethyl-transferring glycine dehydrogenase subunit GcvPA [Alphaproteobacteria bacterium]|nr:aminomethyl-transferring glycine dehydrogenase subunit GcvPA [Alphaproteobacteria bacterium]